MSKRSKKKAGNAASRLSDRYESAILPSYGMGLETFIPGEYSMNDPAVIEAGYRDAETQLEGIADTCDAHSTGAEGDAFVDSQLRHTAAVMESEIAERDYQVARIRSAWEMRKAAISRSIRKLEEEVAELDARIEPLKDLHTQFNLRIGKRAISIGVIVTLLAFLLDSVVNYSFLQNYLLTNRNLLAITVATMAVMSDGSMWALGTLLSRRHERFVPKGVFITGCVSLVLCFLLSIAATVMIRFGSMDATYGTVNAAGAFVGKASYSLAEYGITLITAFVTTCTGILSFIFSLDENAVAVSRRVRWEAQRAARAAELEALRCELSLLEGAPDPAVRDAARREAARNQIEADRIGLKLRFRKMLILRIKDADFTDRMARSADALLEGNPGTAPTPLFDPNCQNRDLEMVG